MFIYVKLIHSQPELAVNGGAVTSFACRCSFNCFVATALMGMLMPRCCTIRVVQSLIGSSLGVQSALYDALWEWLIGWAWRLYTPPPNLPLTLKICTTDQNFCSQDGASNSSEVNFLDFVEYFLSRPVMLLGDVHFLPIQRLCHPCYVRYDYYGNFDSFERDVHILMDRFGASDEYLRPSYYSNASTTHYEEYYKLLSEDQRRSIFNYYKEELEFYYLLFPRERGIHKSILNISDDNIRMN